MSMSRNTYFWRAVLITLVVLGCSSAYAQLVGEPSAFDIAVMQGTQLIAQKHVTVGAGKDLPDIKTTYQDGTPESFVQLITMTASHTPSPIILKLVSEPTPNAAMYRLLHFYIDAPLSMSNINLPGPVSLFNSNSLDQISVSVTNMTFSNGEGAMPQLGNDPYYFASFMRDVNGHFYQSPKTNPYNFAGHGIYDIQVPGSAYLDSDTSQYTFSSTPGVSSSCTWGNIPNPGQTTKVHNGIQGGVSPAQPGYVYELGLSVAYTYYLPEPASLSLLLIGALMIKRRR
jgi:hypothetical protein